MQNPGISTSIYPPSLLNSHYSLNVNQTDIVIVGIDIYSPSSALDIKLKHIHNYIQYNRSLIGKVKFI